MSEDTQQNHISKKTVVYRIPEMDAVTVRRDEVYSATDSGDLTMDIYYPVDSQSGARLPAVVFVSGYPDDGFQRVVGCKFKEMGAYISWGRLTAASGIAAITYTNKEPAADIRALLEYVRHNAEQLGIDEKRIGLWACSGNAPMAMSILMQRSNEYIKCAALCYGFMLDLDGATGVAEAAAQFRFVNPCEGKSVDDLPQDLPLFVVRAGQDRTLHINEAIDRFLAKALTRNLPVTFVNLSNAPHAFDLFDDSESSREAIKQILAFLRFHLLT